MSDELSVPRVREKILVFVRIRSAVFNRMKSGSANERVMFTTKFTEFISNKANVITPLRLALELKPLSINLK